MRRADAHGLEQLLGGVGAALAGLVDLGGGHRLGEGQLGVLHHHAAQQGDEEDAEDAADDHERRGLPVVGRGVEVHRPCRMTKAGMREDGAGGDRLADRADGAGEVLLEDGALEDAQHGHADDRGRVGGGDGHAGAQAEVGVGRAEHDGHDQAQHSTAPRSVNSAGIDLQRLLDQVTQGRWPAQGQTPVMVVQTTTAPEPLPPGVRAIALEPDRFEGQHVRVIGGFRGANLHGDLPQSPGRSRWDFVLRSADAAVWVLGERPRGKGFNLDPSRRLDTGRALEVTGTVRTDRGLVWIDADSVTLTTEAVPAGVVEAPLPPVQGAPPQVAFSIPIDGDIDVQPDATIRIQFTRDMAPESFRERVRISYADAGHTPLPEPKTVYRGDNRVLEVRPAAPLERFGTVKVELLEGIEATDGAPLAPWVMTFTVAGT
jgi:hypothetical protein